MNLEARQEEKERQEKTTLIFRLKWFLSLTFFSSSSLSFKESVSKSLKEKELIILVVSLQLGWKILCFFRRDYMRLSYKCFSGYYNSQEKKYIYLILI